MLFIVAVAIFVVMLMFVDCDLPLNPAETDTQLGRPSAARREGSFVYDVGFGWRGNPPPPPTQQETQRSAETSLHPPKEGELGI